MKCHVCGCTETTPCIDALNRPCAWVTPTLCSACFPQASCGIDAEREISEGSPPILEIRCCARDRAFAELLGARLAEAGLPADLLEGPGQTIPNDGGAS
jgi:hypothetical protein